MNDLDFEELAQGLKELSKRMEKELKELNAPYLQWMRDSWRNPQNIRPKPTKQPQRATNWHRIRSNPKQR